MTHQGSTITAPIDGPAAQPQRAASTAVPTTLARAVAKARATTIEQRFLALLLVLFLVKGIVITFVHAPFTGHDEVAHFAYLEVLSYEHRVPILPELFQWRDDFSAQAPVRHDRMPEELWRYCWHALDWRAGCTPEGTGNSNYAITFSGRYYPAGWIYTANHPPLYYLAMLPVYWLTDGLSIEDQLYAMRLVAIPFGMLTVFFAYLTARTLFPGDRFLATMVPAFVAFQPQISYESAMLNNDIMAIMFTSAVVYLLARGLKQGFPLRTVLLIGTCYGLAVLSKNTSLTTGVLIAAAMVFGIGLRRWKEWLPKGALAMLVTALLIWPWYAYMYRTYGDFTALHQIGDLQSWWNGGDARDFPTIWDQLKDKSFFWLRWRETWGEFGWRYVKLGSPGNWPLLRIIMWFAMMATVGLAVWAIRLWRTGHRLATAESDDAADAVRADAGPVFALERWQVVGVMVMALACIIGYLAVLQFGTTFSLTQARYYFPAIVPAALLFMLGWRALLPRRWLNLGQVTMFGALVLLNIIIYSAFVLPFVQNPNYR